MVSCYGLVVIVELFAKRLPISVILPLILPDGSIVRCPGKCSIDFTLGTDIILGDFGDDFIRGGTLDPTSTPDVERDWLFGNRGQDTLIGDAGDDSLWGGKDNDLLQGEAGNDRLFGDIGSDTLMGGEGKNIVALGRLTGIPGILSTGGNTRSDADRIDDLGRGEDRIELIGGLTF
ncbi:MAG: hypothetical protein WA882_15390, partial [Geitlerinemataceae cyanobacterium]